MQGESKDIIPNQSDGSKQDKPFVSIEKKISRRFAQVIMLCCIVLGVIISILSYISSVSAVSKTINNTSDVAADYVAAAIDKYVSVAYETGSIARLADPNRSVLDKAAILKQRIKDHDFEGGYLLDSKGVDVISGVNLSEKEYFKQGMKGNTYISTPAYSTVTNAVSFVVAASLMGRRYSGNDSGGRCGLCSQRRVFERYYAFHKGGQGRHRVYD